MGEITVFALEKKFFKAKTLYKKYDSFLTMKKRIYYIKKKLLIVLAHLHFLKIHFLLSLCKCTTTKSYARQN